MVQIKKLTSSKIQLVVIKSLKLITGEQQSPSGRHF